jgi:hypothetical protein
VLIKGEEATDDSGGYEGRFDNSKTDDRKRERERHTHTHTHTHTT